MDIQQLKLSDLTTLHKICCEAYCQNFADHWEDGGLEYYINKVFGIETLKSELSDKNIQYYAAFINKEPVAFMKINLFSNLPDLDKEKGLELDKVYILPQFKGMKIGKRLLDIAFDIAKREKKEIFWLSVIDTNKEAISFYEKVGFQFHSKTRLEYPKFKEELKGMWRMYFELPVNTN
jgi:diamine N-acetyltransferase